MTSWQAHSDRHVLRVRPFQGVRFTRRAGALDDLTFTPPTSWSSLPADLLDRLDPHHVLHLLSPAFAGDPVDGARRVRRRLKTWLGDRILGRDDDPALYVYEQSAGSHPVVGVVGAVDLSPDGSPPFLDHEEVIGSLVDAQEALVRTAEVQVEPILALHRGTPSLSPVLDKLTDTAPTSQVVDSAGTTHRMWTVAEPALQRQITEALPDSPSLIADGHHRRAAWYRIGAGGADLPYRWALTLLLDATQPGIRLGAVHRVISGLAIRQAVDSSKVRAHRLAGREAAEEFLGDGPRARCVLYGSGAFYAATPAEASPLCAAPELAVCHLHSHWLPAWGVSDAAVSYVHELSDAVELADDTARMGVLLPGVPIQEVFAAAEENRPLPRKATSFGPKPLVGLVFRAWDADSDS